MIETHLPIAGLDKWTKDTVKLARHNVRQKTCDAMETT
jgi:hypothetical protein